MDQLTGRTAQTHSPVDSEPLTLLKLQQFASRATNLDEFIALIRAARQGDIACLPGKKTPTL